MQKLLHFEHNPHNDLTLCVGPVGFLFSNPYAFKEIFSLHLNIINFNFVVISPQSMWPECYVKLLGWIGCTVATRENYVLGRRP
jgi:hypothetical protein